MLKYLHNSNTCYTFAASNKNKSKNDTNSSSYIINHFNNGQASRQVTKIMAIFRIVEFNNAGRENNFRDFQSYECCKKAFRKELKEWRKFEEKTARIQTSITEHSPFCFSLHQEGKIQLTWEIIVIPENTI